MLKVLQVASICQFEKVSYACLYLYLVGELSKIYSIYDVHALTKSSRPELLVVSIIRPRELSVRTAHRDVLQNEKN